MIFNKKENIMDNNSSENDIGEGIKKFIKNVDDNENKDVLKKLERSHLSTISRKSKISRKKKNKAQKKSRRKNRK